MKPPSQEYFRQPPDPALVAYVEGLPFDKIFRVNDLWRDYNLRKGYHGSFRVFKYFLQKAGMSYAPGGLIRERTPS